MRFVLIALLTVLGSGCASKKAAGPDAMLAENKAGKAAAPAAAPSGGKRSSNPAVTPDQGLSGKVVSANPVLRFVVMDFPVLKMPAIDQRLNVYHNGQKVGEVKVTGPMRDTTIAGDIMVGEAQVGDEVRED